MSTDYTKQSDIELSTKLKVLSREFKRLENKRNTSNPSTPQEFVEQAKVDTEIEELKTEQIAIGRVMLERDKQRQKVTSKQLESKFITGAEKANELLERLPEFADKVAVAFQVLGDEYAELLSLSQEIRKTNMVLLGANRHQCIPAALRVEPNNLHKLLKKQFRACFGTDTANVFIPQQTHNFDIIEAVKQIQQECTAKRQEVNRV